MQTTPGSRILGISAYYHDSAAAITVDGHILAAAQEERFTRKKHDPGFPRHAIAFCLETAELSLEDLDYVVFYEKPFIKFDRLLESHLQRAPGGWRAFLTAMPGWLTEKLHLRKDLRQRLGSRCRAPLAFCLHHESHAASAFFPSPFEEAAILTIDGAGEWDTACIAHGRGNHLRILKTLRFPDSLGLLYSAFTYYCGFRVNSGEYKLMGLAPYGQPRYRDPILQHLIHICEDGSFHLNQKYFSYNAGLRMTSRHFDELFGGPARPPDAPPGEREMDLAASIQSVTEEVVLKMGRYVRQLTGLPRLCLAGGVALNCVANGKLLRSGLFEDIWVQPAAGDAGGAVGAALLLHHQLLGHPRQPQLPDAMQGCALGPAFAGPEIEECLLRGDWNYEKIETESLLLEQVVRELAEGAVVGWFQGRMEFGPRALGHRSILGDPRRPDMQSRMNLKIKFRESFRPFAPSVLEDEAAEWFQIDRPSPYMLLTADVQASRRLDDPLPPPPPQDLLARLARPRSQLPSITHLDGSARLQTVAPGQGRFYRLLRAWKTFTGCPVLINTSFNVRGEPIVCSPEDALRCFASTAMDLLVIGNFLLYKNRQNPQRRAEPVSQPHFPLD